MRHYSRRRLRDCLEGTMKFCSTESFFVLLNPKDSDSRSKALLQEALRIYTEELPAMNFAANTGKASQFLERCLLSGKYSTLLFCSTLTEGSRKAIAAITFQIIPVDTQFAEIPIAAVSSNFQRKGIGCMMYEELKERLRRVGILTLFCWADMESEQFWLKQGFIMVGEVDGKGKAHKLPVRAAIRRALCFPGNAVLMVAHLKMDISALMGPSQLSNALLSKENENEENPNSSTSFDLRSLSMKDFTLMNTLNRKGSIDVANKSQPRGKRLEWEASVSSLNSKRIKGSHVNYYYLSSDQNCKSQVERSPNKRDGRRVEEHCPQIMFMNIGDDEKRSKLTKIVEELGGFVTSCGSSCTHVITGKVRRTSNFFLSLCSGAWIVSSSWLKYSFREGRFVDESQHILEDDDYWMKYKCKLRDSITRAKENPHSLLKGYQVCLSKHIQPSIRDLSSIILSAGGSVIRDLRCVKEPSKTIFIACEEDMEQALLAAKMQVRAYGSEWLMNCVMRQELDLEAHQFSESL